MAAIKRLKLAAIHEILPQEIIVMIFKKLGYKSLDHARDTCKHWRQVVDGFKLLEKASGK